MAVSKNIRELLVMRFRSTMLNRKMCLMKHISDEDRKYMIQSQQKICCSTVKPL